MTGDRKRSDTRACQCALHRFRHYELTQRIAELRCQLTIRSPPHQLRTADGGCDSSHDSSATPESGKYPNQLVLPILKFPKYPSEGHQKQLPGKVRSTEAWYDRFGFYIFLCIGSCRDWLPCCTEAHYRTPNQQGIEA